MRCRVDRCPLPPEAPSPFCYAHLARSRARLARCRCAYRHAERTWRNPDCPVHEAHL